VTPARVISCILSIVAICALAPRLSSQTPAPSQRIVLAASTVLDGKGRILRDTRIVIEGSKILALDPKAGPMIAVKLHILTRKTLGGIETDLDARVLKADGTPLAGLYAAGEVAGFGGGGVHGYRALEGTFLGGCIFSGRAAGRGAALDIT